MTKLFTQEGLIIKQKQIAVQEAKVRAVGKQVGEEAGINCDWHDNFGYEDATRRLQMESSTLARLREEISGAEIIMVPEQNETVRIGVTVIVKLGDQEKELTVGAYGESDPERGLISYNSPLGRAMIGMEVGHRGSVQIAGKLVALEVLKLFPPSYRYRSLVEALAGKNSS